MKFPVPLFVYLVFLFFVAYCGSAHAAKFHVMVGGVDDPARDGKTWETAWGSLAFACERVPAGKVGKAVEHVILVRAGEYVATRTAFPKAGVKVTGEAMGGKMVTRIRASAEWGLSETFDPEKPPKREFLISLVKQPGVTIQKLALESEPGHRITGGIFASGCEGLTVREVAFQDFRWCGIWLYGGRKIDLGHCAFRDASVEKMGHWGGNIRTRWIKESEIHHNRVTQRTGGGYGYKAGGHEKVRIHHNVFDVKNGFAFESAHENEYGVEVDHNWMNHCISIPKSGQAQDPNVRGYDFSFWIHHNKLFHSYTIEGPRNHLIFEHNHVNIAHPNGRVYTHHGGKNHGPVVIRRNIIENVDRSLIWMNQGLAENIHVTHNTVFLADAGSRSGTVLSSWSPERLGVGWTFRNNVVVAAWSQPRRVVPTHREDVAELMKVEGNLFVNCLDVPAGNLSDVPPGLARKGDKPAPFYLPISGASVVDAGVDVGEPFKGAAPDIGAFEFGAEPWGLENVPKPRR